MHTALTAHELRRKIAPYFLRREKKDVLTCSSSSSSTDHSSSSRNDKTPQHKRKLGAAGMHSHGGRQLSTHEAAR
jgi:hypothetical protein